MNRTVVIDCFPESVRRYRETHAIVAVDVIRATTSIVTVVSRGQECYPVASLGDALRTAASLQDPLLVGELAGVKPQGFHMNNSPAELAERTDLTRPMVLLSSSGTRLIDEAGKAECAYIACFRNHRSVARHLATSHDRVAVIGAGARGEFREEDQMCCAWVAGALVCAGFRAEDLQTAEIIERWRGVPAEACADGNSAAYLRRSGQSKDLDFVLQHINDVDKVFLVRDGRIITLADELRHHAATRAAETAQND